MDFAGPLWLGCGPLKPVASLDISQQVVDAAFVLAGQDLQSWTKKTRGRLSHIRDIDEGFQLKDPVKTEFRILLKTQN